MSIARCNYKIKTLATYYNITSEVQAAKPQPTKMFLYSSQFIKRNSSSCTSRRSEPTPAALVTVIVLWGVVLGQTLAHALVTLSVAVRRTSVVRSQKFEAFRVFSVAGTATVEQVQAKPLTVILRGFLEHDCGGQHAVDWSVFKFVEAGVVLLERKIRILDDIVFLFHKYFFSFFIS